MKKTILAFLLSLQFSAYAIDVSGPSYAYKGSSGVSLSAPYNVDLDSCEKFIINSTLVDATYNCRQTIVRTVVKKTVTMPPMTDMPVVKLPLPAPSTKGSSTLDVIPTQQTVDASPGRVEGDFRISCGYSNTSYVDPVIFPNGVSPHLHVFFGNTGVTANSTSDSIANTGASTCAGGIANRTAYWIPAMIDTTDGSAIVPYDIAVYYKTGFGGVKSEDIKPVPAGLKLVSGKASSKTEAEAQVGRFSCIGGVNGVGWQKTIPSNCYQDNDMVMEVAFPQCWDGINLDSPDHQSHMAEATGSGCPKDHPVAIPAISYEIKYRLANVNLTHLKNWRLSSDNYPVNQGAGGYSAHGDYFMGWNTKVRDTFTTQCINKNVDCHADLLGDGTALKFD